MKRLNPNQARAFFCFLLLFYCAQGWMLIFSKAGRKKWHALVPLYGPYCAFQMLGGAPLFFGTIAVSALYGILVKAFFPWVASGGTAQEFMIFDLLFLAFLLAVYIWVCCRLTCAFGKNWAFALGLILLHPFFLMHLGLSKKAVYHGKENTENTFHGAREGKAS